MSDHGQPESPIPALHSNPKVRSVFVNAEPGQVVNAGKYLVSSESSDAGVGVPPRYEHAHLGALVAVPFDSEAVGDIFGRHAES